MKSRYATVMMGLILVGAAGCALPATEPTGTSQDDLSLVPDALKPPFVRGLEWMDRLEREHPEWYVTSARSERDARPWRDGYDPRTDPIFAHNEMVMSGVAPRDVLALLREGRSHRYYANSSAATDCETGEPVTLSLGASYCWTTFGTEQHMTIAELVDGEDESVLAWEGGSFGVAVYHRWILRKSAAGTRVVTEECERGLLPLLAPYRNRMNPSLHAGHELWLEGMRGELARRGR